MSGVRRFYKSVEVAEDRNGFVVILDGKPVKTPQRRLLAMPSRDLAEAVAEEWRVQGDMLEPSSMPLTRLAFAALDTVAAHRARICDENAAYGRADLLCYRAEAPASLVTRQARVWDPLLDWADQRYGGRLITGSGIGFVSQPEASLRSFDKAIADRSDFELAALHGAAAITGSLVLALALLERRLDAAEAFALSRLDEAFQNEAWGIDAAAAARNARLRADLEAMARFLRLALP